ncbi:MAG: BLUF domain-containing protein [Pseudomonadota bacterium]
MTSPVSTLPPEDRHSPKIGVLYSSWTSQPDNIAVVSDLLRTSRLRNHDRGIDGTLVFDGEIFVQFMYGDSRLVRALQGAIWADTRHRGILLLHDGPVKPSCVPTAWRSGWASPDALKIFRHAPLTDRDRVAEFLALLPAFDLL